MTTTFKLTKKRLDKLELVDYIYQVKVTDLWCLREFENKLEELSRKKFRKNLNQQNEIKKLLKSLDILPEHIYYFNDLKIKEVINFEEPSMLFTGIKQVSFDQGGLIVLQHFNQEIYTLHDKDGNDLLKKYCSELNIGTDGLIEYRIEGETEENYEEIEGVGFVSVGGQSPLHYGLVQNGKFIDISDSNRYNYETFPHIYDRDKIQLMDNFIKPNYTKTQLKKMTDNITVRNILKEDGTLIRYMSDLVRNNEKLCKLSVEQNELSFTLIPETLQNDKSFVIKLFSSNKVHSKIKRFFNSKLKEDEDILKIEKMKKKKEDDLKKIEFRRMFPPNESSKDNLPF